MWTRSLLVALLPAAALVAVLATAEPSVHAPSSSERWPALASRSTTADATARATAAESCAAPTTSDRPAERTGPEVHVAHVIPLDGEERLAEAAPQIEGQVAAIEAWWRGQDPGRVPRFDRYRASCGPQLDIVTIRLDRTERSVGRLADIGGLIVDEIAAAGLLGPSRSVLAFYDGPGGLPEVCGEGAGELDGEGVAVVFTRACPDVPGELIAAHELVHGLGALPPGAPNACPDDDGHPCDSPDDVIWPRASARPLESVVLDVGRDDYYGHTGDQPDLRDSVFLRRLDERPTRIVLTIAGAGEVRSDVPGLRCRASCTTVWDGRFPIDLTARAADAGRVARWSGACTGRGPCRLGLGGGRVDVSVRFAPPVFPLTVAVRGSGTVARRGTDAPCRRTCAADVRSFSAVALRAVPASGWRLSRWEGACQGRASVCTVSMSSARAVRAVFERTAT